jgi:hypothetical protein
LRQIVAPNTRHLEFYKIMTGEELFKALKQMSDKGLPPGIREQRMKRLSERTGLSSDALRAKARRWAKANGKEYPLMRARAEPEAIQSRAESRSLRAAWRAERVRTGAEALARGASWLEIATLWNLRTAEAAQQWWRRNQEGAKRRSRKTRGLRRS